MIRLPHFFGLSFSLIAVLTIMIFVVTLLSNCLAWLLKTIINITGASKLDRKKRSVQLKTIKVVKKTSKTREITAFDGRLHWSDLRLVTICLLIFAITVMVFGNSLEVVAKFDLPYLSNIKAIEVSQSASFNQWLDANYDRKFDEGDFGVPASIKFPEMSNYIEIDKAYRNNQQRWLNRKGHAAMLITNHARRKVFGQSVIFLRTGLPTTAVGQIVESDAIEVITDKGWRLTYEVRQLGQDPDNLTKTIAQTTSELIIAMIDEETNQIASLRAGLLRIGERY